MIQKMIATFLTLLFYISAFGQEVQPQPLTQEESFMQEYNAIIQSLQPYDLERKNCFSKNEFTQNNSDPNSHQTVIKDTIEDCIWTLSQQSYIKDQIKKISVFNEKHRNHYLSGSNSNKEEDIEYIYYYGYCSKDIVSTRKLFSALLQLPLNLLKNNCDPRLPSFQDVHTGVITPEQEKYMAKILCLKHHDPKYKDCEMQNLDNYMEQNQYTRKYIDFLRIPNGMIKKSQISKVKKQSGL